MPAYVSLAAMCIGLALFLPLRKRLYGAAGRSCGERRGEDPQGEPAPVSVVICCQDEGEALERSLPAILGQENARFEVVVVDGGSADSTPEVLKRYEKTHRNLRHTFVPGSARYVSREKLAVTLGVKAAKHEWIILTRAGCTPRSSAWIETMSRSFTAGNDIALGYSNFRYDGSCAARRAIYDRLLCQLAWFRSARRGASGGDGCNLAFRRSVFLSGNGYASTLDYTYGVDDLLVNSLSRPGRTAVCVSASAIVEQQCAMSAHVYRGWKMLRCVARRQSGAKGRPGRMAGFLMNSGLLLAAAGGAAAAVSAFSVQRYAFAAAVCSALIAACAANVIMFRKVTAAFGAPSYIFSLVFYDMARPLSSLLWNLRCRRHRKEFNRKI